VERDGLGWHAALGDALPAREGCERHSVTSLLASSPSALPPTACAPAARARG
jgi:hypothetical protein